MLVAEKERLLAAARSAAQAGNETARADYAEKSRRLVVMERECSLAKQNLVQVELRFNAHGHKLENVQSMYDTHWRALLEESTYRAQSSSSITDLTKMCSCGNQFLPDSAYCRRCGKHRDSVTVTTRSEYTRHVPLPQLTLRRCAHVVTSFYQTLHIA